MSVPECEPKQSPISSQEEFEPTKIPGMFTKNGKTYRIINGKLCQVVDMNDVIKDWRKREDEQLPCLQSTISHSGSRTSRKGIGSGDVS